MRRTLQGFGWLDGEAALTEQGHVFLDSEPESVQEREVLCAALWDLTLDPGPSHPIRVLLRLLAVAESNARQGLELALEAADDGDAEFARVQHLYEMTPAARTAALHAIGVTDTQIANAKKIFPSLARAAGLVIEQPLHTYRLSDLGQAFVTAGFGGPPAPPAGEAMEPAVVQVRARRMLRLVGPEMIARTVASGEGRVLSAAEQLAARAALAARSTRHNEVVRTLARRFDANAGEFLEGSVDLLWRPHDLTRPMVLNEVKTIDGDEDSQIRDAVGQLLFYRYFDVAPLDAQRAIRLVAAVDKPVSEELAAFLTDLDIALIVVTPNGCARQSPSGGSRRVPRPVHRRVATTAPREGTSRPDLNCDRRRELDKSADTVDELHVLERSAVRVKQLGCRDEYRETLCARDRDVAAMARE